MSNTIPTQTSWTVAPLRQPAREDAPAARKPGGDAGGSRKVPSRSGESGNPGRISPAKGDTGVVERTAEAIRSAVADEIAEAAERSDRSGIRVSTEVHEPTGRYVVKVIESDSGKVIREFPPADYLDVIAALEELGGLLLEGRI